MEGHLEMHEWNGAHYFLKGPKPPKNEAVARISAVLKKYVNKVAKRKLMNVGFYAPSVMEILSQIDMKQ